MPSFCHRGPAQRLARSILNLITANAFWLFWCALPASAETFIVSKTQDGTGRGTLRGEIIAAGLQEGEHVIVLKEGTYQLSLPRATNTAPGFSGALAVTRGRLGIVGVGTNVTISAASTLGDRIFKVDGGVHLKLSRLTITGGISPRGTNGFNEDGAGIHNRGWLELDHCTVTSNFCEPANFIPSDDRFGGKGGAIYNSGVLTIKRCDIEGNASGSNDFGDGEDGGAIYNDHTGTIVIRQSSVSHNQCGSATLSTFIVIGWPPPPPRLGGSGGGICNLGKLIVSDSILSTNAAGADQADNLGFGGNGGGLCNRGRAFISASSIYANSGGLGTHGGLGGGIFNSGNLTIGTSTISGNTAGQGGTAGNFFGFGAPGGPGGNGGGIYNAGILLTKSCTIASNQAGCGGIGGSFSTSVPFGGPGGNGGSGGGIFNTASNAPTRLGNTLIAQNLSGTGGPGGTNQSGTIEPMGFAGEFPDVAGTFLSDGFNLIGITDVGAILLNGTNLDLLGSVAAPLDPLIGPLEMNGGPTPTHALLPASPAVDRGNSFGTHRDQRGVRRPFDNREIANPRRGDGSDIGAYELKTR